MRTLLDYLQDRFRRQPDSVVCHFLAGEAETSIRQSDLIARAQAYAALYRLRGVSRKQPVLIILRHTPDLLYAFVGALLAGAVPAFLAPISEKQDAERYWSSLRQLVAQVNAGAVVIGPADRGEFVAHVDVAGLPLLAPEDCPLAAPAAPWPDPAPEDIAFLQFSSGTTGLRRGVALSHAQVVAQIEAAGQALQFAAGDRIASWLPLYHDMGLIACLVMPLALGMPLVMLDPFEWVYRPSLLLRAIERYRATHVWLPNFAFNHLAASVEPEERYDLSSIKAFINCSEPCKAASMQGFVHRFAAMRVTAAQMHVCYAMAEAVFAVTQTSLGEPVRVLRVDSETLAASGRIVETDAGVELVSAGRPLAGIDVAIRGEDGSQLPDKRVGEIAIRGSCIFFGYYASTDAAFDGGWFRTGDLGFLHAGELYVTGRKKDVIISYGKNYYAHDIEAVVSEVSGVKRGRAVAFGLHNEVSGSEDVIVVAESPVGGEGAQRALAREVKSAVLQALNLTVAKVAIVAPQWLAKTTSGKISRSDNRTKYLRLAPSALKRAG